MAAPTTATFHLPHAPDEPLELSFKHPALAMAVVTRDGLAALENRWTKAIGVYVLLGPAGDDKHEYRCYVGQSGTGGLKARLSTHRHSQSWEKRHELPKDWWKRALIVRSRDEDGFNSAEAGWLEGRLWGILDSAPTAELVGKRGDDQTLPQHERDRLVQYLPPITAVLRAIGASPDTPDQQPPPKRIKKHNATVLDLIKAGLLTPGVKLRSISSLHEAIAVVGEAGDLTVDGQAYDSPSGAAAAAVGHEMNGWTFWGFQSGDGTLVPLAALRVQLDPAKPPDTEEEHVAAPPEPPVEDEKKQDVVAKSGSLSGLVDAGVIPAGETLFATFRGHQHVATIDADGRIHLDDGNVYNNPSGAARAITGYETNGWTFWKVHIAGKETRLTTLRSQLKALGK